jgi:hypothetical protein
MSRRDHDYVWYQYYYCKKEAMCPVCEKNRMFKNDHQTWNREHILKLSFGGPDTYPNLVPICRDCNLGMGKRCKSTFEYMAKIEKISFDRALKLEREHVEACLKFDPVCEKIQKNGFRCHNLKGGKKELWCWKHINEELEPMDIETWEDEPEEANLLRLTI